MQIRAQKFLGALDVDMNGPRYMRDRGSNTRSLKRNHYITSKQRKIVVFSMTFTWDYRSNGTILRYYSQYLCPDSVHTDHLSATLHSVKIYRRYIYLIKSIKDRSFCHKHCAELSHIVARITSYMSIRNIYYAIYVTS